MAFGRRKSNDARDPFAHLADERREAEAGSPWFLGPDEGPELDVQAGISSNLSDDELEGHGSDESDQPGEPGPPGPPGERSDGG